MAIVVAVGVYYFLVHFFLAEIFSVPRYLVAKYFTSDTSFKIGLLVLATTFSGIALWFGACLAPVIILKSLLYPAASYRWWFILPAISGLLARRLLSARASA